MYNLTSKKYIFFAISLVVLIPGFISLLFNHLNLGIDFTGGTTVDLNLSFRAEQPGRQLRHATVHHASARQGRENLSLPRRGESE